MLTDMASAGFNITDGSGNTGLNLRRPGYRISDTNLEAEKRAVADRDPMDG